MEYHRETALALIGINALAALTCAGIGLVRQDRFSYTYSISIPTLREGDPPEFSIFIHPTEDHTLTLKSMAVSWNGELFNSEPNLELPVEWDRLPTLKDYGLYLPPARGGRSIFKVHHLEMAAATGEVLEFPGEVEVNTTIVDRDSDLLMELQYATRLLPEEEEAGGTCRDLARLGRRLTPEERVDAESMVGRSGEALDAARHALLLTGTRHPTSWGRGLQWGGVGIRHIGCLLVLKGELELARGRKRSGAEGYVEALHLALGMILSSDGLLPAIIGYSVGELASVALGNVLARGEFGTEDLLFLQQKVSELQERVRTQAPTTEEILNAELADVRNLTLVYSPLGPIERMVLNAIATPQYFGYEDRFKRFPVRLSVIGTAVGACLYDREHGVVPSDLGELIKWNAGRVLMEESTDGLTIEAISRHEVVVAKRTQSSDADPGEICWTKMDGCSGPIGLQAQCTP